MTQDTGYRRPVPDHDADRAPGHYFEAQPSSDRAPRMVQLVTVDGAIDLETDRGVFSHDAVDVGTQLLLAEGPPVRDGGVIVDVGCGYGPIAATLARRAPAARIWATDSNARARELCTRNAERLGLANIEVHAADEAPDTGVDEIWSNPPIRIGKAALRSLLTTWLDRLNPDGRAVLVVQKHLGADSLAAWLTDQGWTTTRLVSRRGFRILEVSARAAARTD